MFSGYRALIANYGLDGVGVVVVVGLAFSAGRNELLGMTSGELPIPQSA